MINKNGKNNQQYNQDNISKEDIKKISYISFYCRSCEEIVDVDIDKKDKKYICVKCKNKSILIGKKEGIVEYVNIKK